MKKIILIGVGSSAGGLEALTELFANIPKALQSVASFIVVQHLSPQYRSLLVQILSKDSVFPVMEAKHQLPIEPGFVYVTPPDKEISVLRGFIQLTTPVVELGIQHSIDRMLTSLANVYGKNAVAIILSGTGADGAIGLQAVKNKGGYAMIQNPDNAKYNGMPLASLQTGAVDQSLAPHQMGAKLEEILLTVASKRIMKNTDIDLQAIFALLHARFGTNFDNYKSSTILRRIDKCMEALKMKDFKEYADYLEKNPAEQLTLYQSFLINVTSFFRDAEAFAKLENTLNEKIAKLGMQDHFRIWVAGCSTGEEAVGLAMIAQQLLDRHRMYHCTLRVFATDIDDEALNTARKGVYSFDSVKKIPAPLLEKYMLRTEKGYEVNRDLRGKILFSKHDITINPPFLKIDLLSCRNLLIYLNPPTQRQIFPIFHYALKENGLLFLGKSESVTQVDELFEQIDLHFKLFHKRTFASASTALKFNALKPLGFTPEWNRRKAAGTALQNPKAGLFEALANLTQHPYLILNQMLDIIETKGDLTDLLQWPEGVMNLNMNRLLRKEIQAEVKNLLLLVSKEKTNKASLIKRLFINEKHLYVKFYCAYLDKEGYGNGQELYLLVFEILDLDIEMPKTESGTTTATEHARILELEDELNITKEYLQTYIEETETASEGLQLLNEELQSSNEELQSSNEELETGNEELQSANEEVQTAYNEIKQINAELTRKDQALKETNALFNTVFENTEQGSILINADLKIKVINNEARYLLKQLGVDSLMVGKNLLESLPYDLINSLSPLVQRAKDQQEAVKEIVEAVHQAQKYSYQFCFTPVLLPVEKVIDYLVVSILDITVIKRQQQEVFERDEMLVSLLASHSTYLIRTDMEGRYTYVNDSFCEKFGFAREQIIGKHYAPTVHPEDLIECEKAVERLFASPNAIVPFEIRKPNPAGGYFFTEWEFVAIRNQQGDIVEVQGIGRDITGHQVAKNEVEQQRNRLEMVIWGGRLGTSDWNIVLDTIVFNERWGDMLGYSTHEYPVTFDAWQALIHPDDRPKMIKMFTDNIQGNIAFYEIELRKKTKDGPWKWVMSTGKVIERDLRGKAMRLIGIHQDITEKKRSEEAIIEKNKELQAINEAVKVEHVKTEEALFSLQKAQMQLVHSEKLASLGLLTAGVAHEINNPVNFVLGGAQALEPILDDLLKLMKQYEQLIKTEDDAEKKRIEQEIQSIKDYAGGEASINNLTQALLGGIKEGANRIAGIVSSLRNFSHSDKGIRESAHLHQNIEDTLLILRSQYRDRIEIEKRFDPAIEYINCYPGELGQVFMNILANAIQAIEGNGRIVITTSTYEKGVQISIKDSGAGIPEEIRAKIFDPFFSTKPVGKGTGLGLSIVHGIIEKHGGSIEVHSALGKGTEFVIVLPQ